MVQTHQLKYSNCFIPATTFIAKHNTSFTHSFAYGESVPGYRLRVASMLIGNNLF